MGGSGLIHPSFLHNKHSLPGRVDFQCLLNIWQKKSAPFFQSDSVLFDLTEGWRKKEWGVLLLNQGTECPLSRGTARERGCLEDVSWGGGCPERLRPPEDHTMYTEMGTLRLAWHIFQCFYYLYKPKSWSVSGLKASLLQWIMNLNEAFCVDYLMIHSSVAITLGCAEGKKKKQDVFRWHFWFMAFFLWFIILRYSIWKAKSLMLSDKIIYLQCEESHVDNSERSNRDRGTLSFLMIHHQVGLTLKIRDSLDKRTTCGSLLFL